MSAVPSEAGSSRRPRRVLWWAALLLVIVPLAWLSLPATTRFYTDAETIKEPREDAQPRDILWQPPRLMDFGISLPDDLYEPRLSADGLTLYFVRGKAGGGGEGHADLVVSRRSFEGWSPPVPIPGVNSDADDLGPEISPDGQTLYFYSNRDGGFGGYDLWVARRAIEGAPFETPENLGPHINSPFNEYGPAVSGDGATLYFASNRPRSADEEIPDAPAWSATLREDLFQRTYDLYAAALNADDPITATPLTLLNTAANEGSPAISPSGDFLYFSSDRSDGRGGFDLYRARRLRGTLTEVINLGSAINTRANELDPALSLGGFALHFSSDRRADDGGAAPPAYQLFQSMSREVFVDAETSRAAINWADVWSALAPNLLWALLALLMVLLLVATLRAARDRRLSLIARCLLASLALHTLLMLWFTVWHVSATLAGLGNKKGEIRVALASSGSSALHTQIRGDLATVADAGASMQPAMHIPAMPPVTMPAPMTSQPLVVETPPPMIIPPMQAAEAVLDFSDADTVHLASSHATNVEWKKTPERMIDFAAPQQLRQQSAAERTADAQPVTGLMVGSSNLAPPSVPPALEFREQRVDPVPSSAPRDESGIRAADIARFADSSPPMKAVATTIDRAASAPRPMLAELALPRERPAQSTGEVEVQVPNVVGGLTPVQPPSIPIRVGTTVAAVEIALPTAVASNQSHGIDWREAALDASPNRIPSTRVVDIAAIASSPAFPMPAAFFQVNDAPKSATPEIVGPEKSPTWTLASSAPPMSGEAILPQSSDWSGSPASVAIPVSTTHDGQVVAVETVFADATPMGLAQSTLPLSWTDEISAPHMTAMELPVAFDLPIAPPEAAAEVLVDAPLHSGRVYGRIVSIRNGDPIADAEIRLDVDATEPVTVRSDADGKYAMEVPTDLPDFFALSAMADGFMPASVNVASRRLRRDGVRVNFRLRPVTSESIAIEAVPDVHHLGDNRFTGQINSQFQKRSEGRRFSATFTVLAAQLHSGAPMVELRLLVKGVQTRHRLLINGQILTQRLDYAPEDGSFGEFVTRFSREKLVAGENTLEIHAGSIGSDVDDFEFVNVQFHLNP